MARKTYKYADGSRQKDIFFLFRDSPIRQTALFAPPDHPARYTLYGMDDLAEKGWRTRHNLNMTQCSGRIYYWTGFLLDRLLCALGGTSGDFATVLASLRAIQSSNLVISTVDSLGVPLLWFRFMGLFSTPIVYVSIGLPERLRKMNVPWQGVYRRLLFQASAVIAYGFEEAKWLKHWLGNEKQVHFVPFGVDIAKWRPTEIWDETTDVLSIGFDSMRDFRLLVHYARRHPEVNVCLVTGRECAASLGDLPLNIRTRISVPIEALKGLIAGARLVVLPVKENTYSGATTTLLQCMAMGKAVAVSRVGAILDGYGFEDGVNIRWMQPGSEESLTSVINGLLEDKSKADSLGHAGRLHVEVHLSWLGYLTRMRQVLDGAINT